MKLISSDAHLAQSRGVMLMWFATAAREDQPFDAVSEPAEADSFGDRNPC